MADRPQSALKDAVFWGLLAAAWLGLGWAYWAFVLDPGLDVISFTFQGRNAEILAPELFGFALLLPILWIIQRFTLSDLPTYQRWINVGIRALIGVALIGALVQVVTTTFESRVSTIFVVDTSASVPDEVLAESKTYINQAIDARGERDDVKVIAFAKRPYEVPLIGDSDDKLRLETIPRPESEKERLASNPAAALRMAYGLFPQDHLKRVVIVTDGNETDGDLLAEAHKATTFGIRVYNREIAFDPPPEILIRSFEFPQDMKVGEPFTAIARVFATDATEARFQLWQNDFKDGSKTIQLEPGMNEVPFETEVHEPGFKKFKLNMKVSGEDHFEENNQFVYSVNVEGKPRVLYVEGEMRSRHYLQRALRNENFEVETRGPYGVPTTFEEFESFDLVLVSDLAAMYLSRDQMKMIDRYVRELGGGFIMVGGENSFGPGGYYGTFIEKTLPVEFEPEKKRDTPQLALMLVIDKSGSMNGDRIELAKDAAKATVEILQRYDKVGVTAFDDGVQTLVRMQSASNRVRILSDISRLRASGGTNIPSALLHAYEQLAITPAKLKHVILLTDGHSDAGTIFTEILPAMRIEGITVTTVAVGGQSDTTLLRRVAEGGGGRYYYTNDPYNVPRIFTKETSTVSRSSMVEEPFRPTVAKRAQVLKGIPWNSAPFLLGYVSTKAKPEAELLLVSDHGEPILARWRRGLGKVVAFTSDLKNRWAVEWVRWPGYAKFWAQLIRDTMRTGDADTLAMTTEVEQQKARIVVDAIGEDDRFINNLESTVAVTAPDGSTRSVKLAQSAAGRYEAELPLDQYGSYGLKATHDKGGDTVAVSLGSISYPYPREYLFVEPNREIVRQAARVGNGETNPTVEKLFDPMGEEVKYRRELWPWFVIAAMLLLVLDLALRRIRLSGQTEISWDSVAGRKA
jgi:Mg-chelatase subunit ChlD